MFGYVKPYQPELKIREYQVFRAHYCGLCACLGRLGGLRARPVVSYEGAFWVLLLSSLGSRPVAYRQGRCPLPPWRLRPLARAGAAQEYVAAVNLVLTYHKLRDDVRDARGRWWRREVARIGAACLRAPVGAVALRFPGVAELVETRLAELARREAEECSDLDMAADPFARLLADLAPGPPEWGGPTGHGRTREALRFLGYNLGKWIYTVDAVADLEEDMAAHRYNAVAAACGGSGDSPGQVRARSRERVRFLLEHCLAAISATLDVLPLGENRGLLENIVCLGMGGQVEAVLEGHRGGCAGEGSLRGAGAQAGGQRSGNQACLPGTGEEVSPRSLP